MPDLDEGRLVDGDDPTISATKEETTLEVKDRTTPESEGGDEEYAEQRQQQRNDKFGVHVLAGEIQEYDPDGYNPLMFE